MSRWVGPLRWTCVAAAAIALVAWSAPRFGIVFVGGWSMSPTLTPGDLVFYRRAPADARERDVVLVVPPGSQAFLHRVLAVRLDGSLRTKGDANPTADPQASDAGQVAGVGLAALPSGRALHAVVSGLRWCYNHVPIANTRR
jgi:signal peptidase I